MSITTPDEFCPSGHNLSPKEGWLLHSDLIKPFAAEYAEYLKDESRSVGTCQYVAFPRSHDEALEILRSAYDQDLPVTIQGGRTGLAAGAVPSGGLIVNTSRMDQVLGMSVRDGLYHLRLQPGVILSRLRKDIESRRLDTAGWDAESLQAMEAFKKDKAQFFTPDPTETSALLGGMTACNASGARSYKYGPVRGHVHALRVILPTGHPLTLERGRMRAKGRRLELVCDDGFALHLDLPTFQMPDTKNASGYYIHDDMDAVDLFIGSDGTLGLITELEIILRPMPGAVWGVTCFFASEEQAVDFVTAARPALGADAAAFEYFDPHALDILRSQRANNPAFAALPVIAPAYGCAVYTELHCADEQAAFDRLMAVGDLMEAAGGCQDHTWVARTDTDRDKLQFFRHAVPESVNMLIDQRRRIDPVITKLGSDMSVPDACLRQVTRMYRQDLAEAGLEYATWGHIGNNHLHVNILPRSADDYSRGKALFARWAEAVTRMGGAVSAEHGVGKLKAPFLTIMYGQKHIDEMRALKLAVDPKGLYGVGNLFSLKGGAAQ